MDEKRIIFVTGTDTGVGKTVVAASLIPALVGRGESVAACKLVETDFRDEADSDSQALLRQQNVGQSLDDVCPYRFPDPVAPAVGFASARGDVQPSDLIAHIVRQLDLATVVVCEGAGGLLVPLLGTYTYADLVQELADAGFNVATIVVVGSRLGAINHTSLTLEVLQRRGLPTLGYVFNDLFRVAEGRDRAIDTNREFVAQLAAGYEIGELCYLPRLEELNHRVARVPAFEALAQQCLDYQIATSPKSKSAANSSSS